MSKKFLPLLLLFLLSFVSSQAQESGLLSADEFQKHLSKPGIQLLDVRTSTEFLKGTIENALHADWLNRKEFENRVEHLDKSKPLYIFCASGGRSRDAATWLSKEGFNVLEMKGGTNEWRKQGKQMTERTSEKQLSIEDYRGMISLSGNVLVDFGAPWCPPCRKMEPELDRLNKDEIQVIKLDPSVHLKLADSLMINTIPTLIYYKNGNEIGRSEGLITTREIESRYR